ncbi:hypothetical protein OAC79_03030 [Amylibacter sp.]|nr:hypothetical protein [Amylibacter sp.]
MTGRLHGRTSLTSLKDSKVGRKALLISNGPSATNLDFDKVCRLQEAGNLDVFALNSFMDGYEEHRIIPNYFMLADPIFFGHSYSSDRHEINDEIDLKKLQKYEHELIYTIPESCVIFVPFSEYRNTCKMNLPNSIIPFCDDTIHFGSATSPLIPTSVWPAAAIHMLRLATFMNYSEIMLIGFDHNQYRTYEIDFENNITDCTKYLLNKRREKNYLIEFSSMMDVFYEMYMVHKSYTHFTHEKVYNLDAHSELGAFRKMRKTDLMKR